MEAIAEAPPPTGHVVHRMATEHLEAALVSWAARLAAGTATWLGLVAEYDRRRGFEAWGCDSCVRWLSWQCGLEPRSAREHLRVARALEGLPAVQGAMAAGELSFSQVRAITRVAVAATEHTWLEVARHATGAQLERAVRATRRARLGGEASLVHAARRVHWSWDDDGSLVLRGRLPADAGAVLVAALEAVLAEAGGVPPAEPEADDGPAARRADALVALAERAASGRGAAAHDGGPTSCAGPSVVLHTTAEGLAAEVGGVLAGGPPVPGPVARRLACDGTLRVQDEQGRSSRRTRLVRGRLRRRLRHRDQGCRWPGCGSRAHLHAHHLRHWSHGGPTTLANLVLLCGPHHRLVHDGGYGLAWLEGELHATRPDGRPIERIAMQPDGPLPLAPATGASAWDGSPLHLDDLVEGVLLLEAAPP